MRSMNAQEEASQVLVACAYSHAKSTNEGEWSHQLQSWQRHWIIATKLPRLFSHTPHAILLRITPSISSGNKIRVIIILCTAFHCCAIPRKTVLEYESEASKLQTPTENPIQIPVVIHVLIFHSGRLCSQFWGSPNAEHWGHCRSHGQSKEKPTLRLVSDRNESFRDRNGLCLITACLKFAQQSAEEAIWGSLRFANVTKSCLTLPLKFWRMLMCSVSL